MPVSYNGVPELLIAAVPEPGEPGEYHEERHSGQDNHFIVMISHSILSTTIKTIPFQVSTQ